LVHPLQAADTSRAGNFCNVGRPAVLQKLQSRVKEPSKSGQNHRPE
jgi:hypothetical protein